MKNKKISLHFKNILVIANKQTGNQIFKMELGVHPTENEALRQFEILQGFDSMITYQSNESKALISLVVVSEKSPRGKEVMRYNLTDITQENRKAEIISNNKRWKMFKTEQVQKEIRHQAIENLELRKTKITKQHTKKVINVKPKNDDEIEIL